MAYVGYFDELVQTVGPQIDAVLEVSDYIINSSKFKKVLEIILAFGNYLNSAKRGPAYGFKLPTFERLLGGNYIYTANLVSLLFCGLH